jgi:FlaA1/EpsC-like NDP-sugar epimerase
MDKLISKQVQIFFRVEIMAMIVLDALLLPIALLTAVYLRLGWEWDSHLTPFIWIFFILPVWTIPIFIKMGLYRAVIKYLDDKIVYIVFVGVTVSLLILIGIIHFYNITAFPRSAIVIYWLFALVYIGGSRFILRSLFKILSNNCERDSVAIYGAGSAGFQLLNSINLGDKYKVEAFFDDDSHKWYKTLKGVTVYPPNKLLKIVKSRHITKILLAVPTIHADMLREIVDFLEQNKIFVKTLPSIEKIINSKVTFNDIQDIIIEDLLGRDAVAPQIELLTKNISNKIVLVTGGGGSIGSEIVRQVIQYNPKLVIVLEMSEFALYNLSRELDQAFNNIKIQYFLGSVLDTNLLNHIFNLYVVDTVFHAAAYKHVPIVEDNICAAIENNVFGSLNLVESAMKFQVKNLVLISTDKAVRPTNIMGISKRIAELIIQAYADNSENTRMSIVRFGNVLGSSGSVIPLFKQQIESGGPITVTHPEVNRYFMTIPEAVELVIQASSLSKEGGEVFVLDMGESIKILDLAKKMLYLSGLNNEDIVIKFTGLRKGEKLSEELLIGDNPVSTEHPRIMKAKEHFIEKTELNKVLIDLKSALLSYDIKKVISLVNILVPEYNKNNVNF